MKDLGCEKCGHDKKLHIKDKCMAVVRPDWKEEYPEDLKRSGITDKYCSCKKFIKVRI